MPKRHQNRRAREQVGRNNPRKSTIITTGTPRKKESVKREAQEHQDTGKTPQVAKVPPSIDPTVGRSKEADSQEMAEEREKRSGSDSNANKHRKSSRVHDNNKATKQPIAHSQQTDDFTDDLRPDNLAGEDHGQGLALEVGLSAYDVKELHGKLADLTDDELKDIPVVQIGSRLEQGAKYIDLQHLERGEFVATAGMVADEDHYYVPKKTTDYVLWNRLNQVTIPARLDESNQ